MTTLYNTGTNRILYKTSNFSTGKTVTAYIWSPALVKSSLLTFTEIADGLYYLDYDFTEEGTYVGKFFEDGVSLTSGIFRVSKVAGSVWDEQIADHTISGSTGEKLQNTSTIGASGGLTIETHTVSDFYKNESAVIVVQVKDHGTPASGLTPTADIYKPDDTSFLSAQDFTEIGTTGIYYLSMDLTGADKGIYKMDIQAEKTTTGSTYSDDFQDGDATGWSTTGATWQVNNESGNYVYQKIDYGGFIYAFSTAGGDQIDFTYEAKVRLDSPGGNYVGLAFRYADTGNNYIFYFRKAAGNVRLMKHTNGGASTLEETNAGSISPAFDTWYNLKVVMSGGNIKCYVDMGSGYELQIDYTDGNPHSTGKVGLFAYNSIGSWDDIDVVPVTSSNKTYQVKDFRVDERPLSKKKFIALK